MSDKISIGIDLGTTNTCACIYRNNVIEVIPNSQGRNIIPSCVTFSNEGRHIGEDAKSRAIFFPTTTIYNAKRIIGRKFDDEKLQRDKDYLPFEIVDDNSTAKIRMVLNGEEKIYMPEEISAMILGDIKDSAEKYLGMAVNDCVITVPAYFNDSQRQATMDAGRIAKFNVLKIINEPTSAAVAYGVLKTTKKEQLILVYDLGGGTFDVSILKIVNRNIEVLATGGNSSLGGEDFTDAIFTHLQDELKKMDKKISDIRSLRRLHVSSEKAKIILSSATHTDVELENFSNDFSLKIPLAREKFEELNTELFVSTMKVVGNCLRDAKLHKKQIDEIVLVGGSTKIPYIQTMVQEYFEGKNLNKSLNADEAVAQGAAIQAYLLNQSSKINPEITISDIIPISLGIKLSSGDMSIIISKNTPIPHSNTKTYLPPSNDSTSVDIIVYEGEKKKAIENRLLGKFSIQGFTSKKHASSELCVTFDIDNNGILTVTCIERLSKIQNRIKILQDKGRMTEEDFAKIRADEQEYRNEAQKRAELSQMKNKLIDLCNSIKQSMLDKDKDDGRSIINECDEILHWTDTNLNANYKDYEDKYNKHLALLDITT